MRGRKYIRRRNFLMRTACGAFGVLLSPALGAGAVPTGVEPLDTSAISAKNPAGVMLAAIARAGTRLVAVGEHGIIIYSDDNGKKWVQASVPVDVTLTCVAFVSPMLGWAAGNFGVILNSSDGGKSWQVQLNGVAANQLTLEAAQAAMSQSNLSPGAPLAVRRANVLVEAGPGVPFLSLLALNSNEVFVFGAWRMTMLTTSGGASWKDWSLHIDDKLSHNLYSATIVNADIYLVGEAGLIFRSTDSGNSFPQVSSPTSATLFGIIGTKDGNIIVFGVAGNIFRSADNGSSWAPIDLGAQDNLSAGYLMSSGTILMASEGGRLFKSSDNGATFSAVTGLPQMSIYGLEEAPNGDLIFIGDSGVTLVRSSILNT